MLVRKPDVVDDHLLVSVAQPLDNLARLEVPKDDLSTARTARDVSAVGAETDLASVPGDSVARESLLLGLLEGAVGVVDQDLVVERLAGKVLF